MTSPQQRNLLARVGVVDARSLAQFSRGRLQDAGRVANRANRDFNTLSQRINADTTSTTQEKEERLQNQRDLRDAQLRRSRDLREEVTQVREALAVEQAFQQRIQRERDVEAQRAARTEEEQAELQRERILRQAREEQAQLERPLDPESRLIDSRITTDGEPVETLGQLDILLGPSEAERVVGGRIGDQAEQREEAIAETPTEPIGERERVTQQEVDDAFGARPTQFDEEELEDFFQEVQLGARLEREAEEPDDAFGATAFRFTDETALAEFIQAAQNKLQQPPTSVELDDDLGAALEQFDPGSLNVFLQTARFRRRAMEIAQAARRRTLDAVSLNDSETAIAISSNADVNLAAAIQAGATPADLAIQGFDVEAVNQASDTASALTEIAPFIDRPAGLGPVLRAEPQFDLARGIAAGVARQTWIEAGFASEVIAGALPAAIATGGDADQLIANGYDRASVIEARANLFAPAAEPRQRPAPGQELPVPASIQRELEEARSTVDITLATSSAGIIPPLAQEANVQLGVIQQAVESVKTGDLTPGEAEVVIREITAEGPVRDPSSRELLALLPIVGSTLAFQDAKVRGFDPLSTGFFALSVGLDVVILAVPTVRAGTAGLRFTAVRIAPALQRAAAASGRAIASPLVRLAKSETGFIRPIPGPGATITPGRAVTAPARPAPSPPAPATPRPEVQPMSPRTIERLFDDAARREKIINDQIRVNEMARRAAEARIRQQFPPGGRPPPGEPPGRGGGGFNFEEEPLEESIRRFLAQQKILKAEIRAKIVAEQNIVNEQAVAARARQVQLRAQFPIRPAEGTTAAARTPQELREQFPIRDEEDVVTGPAARARQEQMREQFPIRPEARDVGGATDVPRAPRETPGRGGGGAPDKPDPRPDPRADPTILDDPLSIPRPRTVEEEAQRLLRLSRAEEVRLLQEQNAINRDVSNRLRTLNEQRTRLANATLTDEQRRVLQQQIAATSQGLRQRLTARFIQPQPRPRPTPRATPTTAPSEIPLVAPSTTPLVAPSLAPLVAPELAPAVTPSLAPLVAPELAPAVTPALEPLVTPAIAPQVTPALEPLVTPAVTPEVTPDPGVVPSVSPAVSQSISPTVSPAVSPAISPAISPAVSLDVSPAVSPALQVATQLGLQTDIETAPTPGVTTDPGTPPPPPPTGTPPPPPPTRTPPPPPPTRTPPPPPPRPRPPRPPRIGPDFGLPGGRTAPAGQFPEIVEWPQGENMVRYNLFTGEQTWTDRKPDGTKANEGFRVVKFTTQRPPLRQMPMGVFVVNTTRFGLDFDQAPGASESASKRADDRFRRRRGRP